MNAEQLTLRKALFSSSMSSGTSTTASTAQQRALTLADLEKMVQVLQGFPPEPIGEWMREQLHPPEQWRVVMPQKVREEALGPVIWPSYVTFSLMVDMPIFIPKEFCAWT